jgi:hypothetical protein
VACAQQCKLKVLLSIVTPECYIVEKQGELIAYNLHGNQLFMEKVSRQMVVESRSVWSAAGLLFTEDPR